MTARKSVKKSSKTTKQTGPSEFAPGVFVGGWDEAVTFAGPRFCVLDEAPKGMPGAAHIRIYDEGTDRADVRALDQLVKSMRSAHSDGSPVLVFCGQGRYRSPLGAAWYLHRVEGLSIDEAYARIRAVRPGAKHLREWLGNAADLDRA